MAARADCANARTFQALDRLSTAVELYNRAREKGDACGSSKQADVVRDLHAQGQDLTLRGILAEALDREDLAIDRYREASRLNAEDEAADGGLERLTDDPFAAAESLARLGRVEEAEAAALSAVENGARIEDSPTAEVLLRKSELERLWLDTLNRVKTWWPLVVALLLLLLLLRSQAGRNQLARRALRNSSLKRLLPTPRLAVEVELATGNDPELANRFAALVRSGVGELGERYAQDPRVVYGSDTPVNVPLDALPSQLKFGAAFLTWLEKRHTLTLRVTLLPPSYDGLACRVALRDASGTTPEGVRVPEQSLRHRPQAWSLEADAASLPWHSLANLVTAWALFAFRSHQAPQELQDEFGTADGDAFTAMLAGVEHGYTAEAISNFRTAIGIDPDFVEAQLNLATALGNHAGAALDEAEVILKDAVLAKLGPSTTDEAPSQGSHELSRFEVRRLGLRYRAEYGLTILLFNQLSKSLGRHQLDDLTRARIDDLRAVAERLAGAVCAPSAVGSRTVDGQARGERENRTDGGADPLAPLRRQMSPHVQILLAGALDLSSKVRQAEEGMKGAAGHVGLPLTLDPQNAVDRDQQRAVEIMAAVPLTGIDPMLHYAMACAWARDARMRFDQTDAALAECARRLVAAMADPSYRERWTNDPELIPLVGHLNPLIKGAALSQRKPMHDQFTPAR